MAFPRSGQRPPIPLSPTFYPQTYESVDKIQASGGKVKKSKG